MVVASDHDTLTCPIDSNIASKLLWLTLIDIFKERDYLMFDGEDEQWPWWKYQ